ncbi:MAG: sulfatase-like hydrolase/transferase [Acidobacteria bacterium]|nr:sulfatase-like hydrolase/transferase [Acidobacteriota bacterium]
MELVLARRSDQPSWIYDLFVAGTAGAAASPRRPDIVFVMLDTLRADALAPYGGDPEWMPRLNAEDPEQTYARADTVTAAVAAWLAERRRATHDLEAAATEPPLFLYVHYLDPHVPYLSSDSLAAERGAFTIPEARGFYEDELRFLDRELDRLVGNLSAELPGPRVLFVTSDHGEEFGEHDGLGHSQTLYAEVLDIPAILQMSGFASGVVDAELEGLDFFDLLLRLEASEALDVGAWASATARESRLASLQFEKDPGRSELIHYLLRPYRDRIYNRTIQRGDWRYIWSAFGRTDELYVRWIDEAKTPLGG